MGASALARETWSMAGNRVSAFLLSVSTPATAAAESEMRFALRSSVLWLAAVVLISRSASAADDAEILSRRVPNQSFYLGETTAFLERGEIT
jgi:hypothetical protein